MFALTLYQPWAQLLATGAKRIETRSWQAIYRGTLLIHAGAAMGADLERISSESPFAASLARYGGYDGLPRRAVIGACRLVNIVPIERVDPYEFSTDEIHYGDFSEGRYAWLTTDNVLFDEPIDVAGNRQLWKPPPEVTHAALERLRGLPAYERGGH